MIAHFLQNFRWYRHWIGGTWYYCRFLVLQGCVFYWTQEPVGDDYVVDVEIF